MNIFYHLSKYISHRQTGKAYIACLEQMGHNVIAGSNGPAGADVAVLHDDPLLYADLFARYPELATMRTIAFCTWENEKLTRHYEPHLGLVDEIWTPSHFCRRSIAARFPHVRVLPHVVERTIPSAQDKIFANERMQSAGPGFRFFSIVDSFNPRKNVRGLLAAFSALRSLMNPKPLLFIKQYRFSFDFSDIAGVYCINEDLTDGQIAALHLFSNAYVSAHHAEGWGLGLSQAMAYGKPVIATGYSGNMDFMNEDNSFPVPYKMAPVSEEMCAVLPLFDRDMLWAEVDTQAFVNSMHRVARGLAPEQLLRNAADITRRFGSERIMARLQELMQAL